MVGKEAIIIHAVCSPKFCIRIIFVFSWDHCKSQSLGGQTRVLWYFPKWPIVKILLSHITYCHQFANQSLIGCRNKGSLVFVVGTFE